MHSHDVRTNKALHVLDNLRKGAVLRQYRVKLHQHEKATVKRNGHILASST